MRSTFTYSTCYKLAALELNLTCIRVLNARLIPFKICCSIFKISKDVGILGYIPVWEQIISNLLGLGAGTFQLVIVPSTPWWFIWWDSVHFLLCDTHLVLGTVFVTPALERWDRRKGNRIQRCNSRERWLSRRKGSSLSHMLLKKEKKKNGEQAKSLWFRTW